MLSGLQQAKCQRKPFDPFLGGPSCEVPDAKHDAHVPGMTDVKPSASPVRRRLKGA